MITTGTCPRCGAATVSVRQAMPWCAGCEWNLDGYDPGRRAPEFGWAWVDRRTYRIAARLTRQQYAALVGRPLESAGLGPAGVAAAIGAPVPQVIGVDGSFNAYSTSVGLRRRRVLCLGLPLWGALDGAERVALVGHELGHFVNGDVRRLLITQPALTMLGDAAELFRPAPGGSAGGLLEMIGDALGRAMSWVLSKLLFGGHLLLVWTALRDSQRAEYLADELAARVAGSAGARGLLDVLLSGESVALVVRQASRGGQGPRAWREGTARARTAAAERMPLVRQLSIREQVSLFASHPPAGLRHQMLTARARHEPRVLLSESRMERIDAELTRQYEGVARIVAWSG
ncbi:M48 family metalloprotease [Micromonospora sp. NPDC051925]|uniref:M48 family metalloprotease n=1 Tax=Micromonospora sp. NPDC051925 TaxID=3364288 RepID=UPI0037C99CF3